VNAIARTFLARGWLGHVRLIVKRGLQKSIVARRPRSPEFSRRTLGATAIVSFSLGILPSCHRPETNVAKGTRLQILHKGNGQEVQDLDPQIVNGVGEYNIICALLEGLVTEDPHDLRPVPGVAERWDISADGKTYTFHLRRKAKWSNDDPVTARDFVESYHRILSPGLAADDAYMLYAVRNAEAFNRGAIKDFVRRLVSARSTTGRSRLA
jgi:oligopeptide transport system substrate-binding protein